MEIPHSEARMRAFKLGPWLPKDVLPHYYRPPPRKMAKIMRQGKGKYVGRAGSEPCHYLLRCRGSQGTWQVTWLLRQPLKECCDFELSISFCVLILLRCKSCSWFFPTRSLFLLLPESLWKYQIQSI